MNNVTCFISYSREPEVNKRWVVELARRLELLHVKVYLDEWDLRPATNLPNYSETAIRESDFVLLICTPEFARRSNKGIGGVGYEKRLITGEKYEGSAPEGKYVPILREGSKRQSIPSYLKGDWYIDFRDESLFKEKIKVLLKHMMRPRKASMPGAFQKFALSPSGPWIDETEALEWAASMEGCNFNAFHELYKFASQKDGLRMIPADALVWVEKWMDCLQEKDIDVFRQLFRFASQQDGLCMIGKDAIDWAVNQVDRFAGRDFNVFLKVYHFARCKDGRRMGRKEALAWAEKLHGDMVDADILKRLRCN